MDKFKIEQPEIGTEIKPEKTEKENFEEVLGMELRKEKKELGGVFSKFPPRINEAIVVAILGLSIFSASIAETRGIGREGDIGRAVEKGIVLVIKNAAEGIGRRIEKIFERTGGATTEREEARKIQEIQREDRDYHRQAEEARDNLMRMLQGRGRRGESAGLGAEYREIAIKNYKLAITAINDAHRAQHFEGGSAITGCRYPDGFSSEFVREIEQLEKF